MVIQKNKKIGVLLVFLMFVFTFSCIPRVDARDKDRDIQDKKVGIQLTNESGTIINQNFYEAGETVYVHSQGNWDIEEGSSLEVIITVTGQKGQELLTLSKTEISAIEINDNSYIIELLEIPEDWTDVGPYHIWIDGKQDMFKVRPIDINNDDNDDDDDDIDDDDDDINDDDDDNDRNNDDSYNVENNNDDNIITEEEIIFPITPIEVIPETIPLPDLPKTGANTIPIFLGGLLLITSGLFANKFYK